MAHLPHMHFDGMAALDKKDLPQLSAISATLCSHQQRTNYGIGGAYLVFALCCAVVTRKYSDHGFSAVLTLAAAVQSLGFCALLLKVRAQKTVAGVSSKCMEMYVLVSLFKLTSTFFKNGYLPQDRSGDWVYQVADTMSLLMIMQILYCIHKSHRFTYQAKYDTLEIWKAVPGFVILSCYVHGDLNSSPFFDAVWMISLNLDTIAMLPQLWMLGKIGGEVEGMTSHFVAAMTVSRALTWVFWFYGYEELAPKDGGMNIVGTYIMAAHTIQLLVSADFMIHYLQARCSGRKMTLPAMEDQA